MEKMKNGLCLELISHPGEIIAEYLEEYNMSQEELALRSGFSKKHISEVINGKKRISMEFAKGLEYALGVPMYYFVNLQKDYDEKILLFHEQNNISIEELEVVKQLKELIKLGEKYKVLKENVKKEERLFELRSFCYVSNLLAIPEVLSSQNRFYRKSNSIEIDPIILYVWLRISEKYAENMTLDTQYDSQKLIKRLPDIKKCMFLDNISAVLKLQKLFYDCGIVFHVMEYVKGAPIQGYVKKQNDKVLLTMTTRRRYADEFWFTLFHEIGHLLNDDLNKGMYMEFDENETAEDEADRFASEELIKKEEFEAFFRKYDFSKEAVEKFAKEQGVMPFIVVGRLQKYTNNYKLLHDMKVRYEWR